MQLIVIGLNHKTAPVAVRERFSFTEERVKYALGRLREYVELREGVILSTCNRTEMYAVAATAEARPVMRDFLLTVTGYPGNPDAYLFSLTNEDCIDHLFRVSASLDSQVVGEGQILSQVKKAYAMARDTGATGTVLNTLFNRAIAVGKRVRTETRIACNAVSISYAAVEQAKKVCRDLTGAKILLLGAGKMSELTARHLLSNGVQTVFVANRRYERAVQLAAKFHGVAVPLEQFREWAVTADIIITSTGAPHYLVRSWDVAHLMPKRNGRPLIFIDIAVPRDVEPEVAALSGVKLYNIDDLEAVVAANVELRQQEAAAAEAIIAAERAELMAKFRYLPFQPTLALLAAKVERIRRRELKRALVKLPELTAEQRKVVVNLSKMLTRKLLREPLVQVNQAAGTVSEQYYVDAVRNLFGLDAGKEKDNGAKGPGCRYAQQ